MKPGGRLVYATCSLLLGRQRRYRSQPFWPVTRNLSLLNAEALLAEQRVQLATGERLRLNPARQYRRIFCRGADPHLNVVHKIQRNRSLARCAPTDGTKDATMPEGFCTLHQVCSAECE